MTDTQRHDRAVALCRDRKSFGMALFVTGQIACHNTFRAVDFVMAAGFPALSCCNGGLHLIDVCASGGQDTKPKGHEARNRHPEAILCSDPSMVSVVPRGMFAQMEPGWNRKTQEHLRLIPLHVLRGARAFWWHLMVSRVKAWALVRFADRSKAIV